MNPKRLATDLRRVAISDLLLSGFQVCAQTLEIISSFVKTAARPLLVAVIGLQLSIGHAQQGEYACEITDWRMAPASTGVQVEPVWGDSPRALCDLLTRDHVVQNCQTSGTFTDQYWGVLAQVQGTDSFSCVQMVGRQECQSGGTMEQEMHRFDISPHML